jgi:hypothetical protein
MLEKMRAKSDSAKKSISLGFTFVIFAGIFFVWLSSWDARTNEQKIRDNTVAPLGGLGAMIDGFVMDVKDAMSGTPSFVKKGDKSNSAAGTSTPATTTANGFDLSGVVIIDNSHATTTR